VIFVGYLMSFCTASTSATQYALLFAAYSITPHLFRPVLSPLMPTLGYTGFFLATIVAVIPGLVLLAFAGRLSSSPPVQSRAP
jgi:MFS transporter, PAT family, beta-lactamase induction signal transducer AmpG